jgi:pilus assembly protein CpaB
MSSSLMTKTNDGRGIRNPRPPKRVRGTAIVLALLLAIGATAAVFLYLSAVKKEHKAPIANFVTVIVSKQDVPADTKLDSLISAGEFTTLQIPRDAIVTGAVTDLSQLRGRTSSTFILQGEQISTARLQGSTHATGGVLGIPAGHQAVTLELPLQKVPGQVLQPGDHVTVYATYTDVSVLGGKSLEAILSGKAQASPATGGATTPETSVGDLTVDLVPDVQVLKVSGEDQAAVTTGTDQVVFVTLALLPGDAQSVVFSQENGSIWLALLPPGQKGAPQGLVSGTSILQRALHGVTK